MQQMTWIRPKRVAIGSAVLLCLGGTALAQVQSPPNPQTKPGATIVINPTEEECKRGWNASMRWTEEQFEEFCAKLATSK